MRLLFIFITLNCKKQSLLSAALSYEQKKQNYNRCSPRLFLKKQSPAPAPFSSVYKKLRPISAALR